MTLTLETLGAPPPADEQPYEPRGATLELFYAREPEVLIEGPADTGKSRGCLQKLDLCAAKYAGMRAGIFRKTRASITQTAMVTFERKVLPSPSAVLFNHEAQEYRYPNGSVVVVSGLDDPEKIKSLELDMAYVQEATELTLDDWEMLRSRLRNDVMPYRQLLADCNPGDPGHWLNERCNEGKTRRLRARHEDNPSITPERIAALDALTGHRYQRLRLGQWVAAEGMFFAEWDPHEHVCEPFDVPAHWPRWLAVDYGFAAPFCCLWFAREPETRDVYVYRELYAAGLRDEQQATLVAEKSEGERIVRRLADPSMFNQRREHGKPSISRVYAQAGVPVSPAVNNRIAGWQTVRRAMACGDGEPPRLRIFRTCPNLVRTIPAMVFDPLDAEDLADEIKGVKTEDHAVDALRYGLMGEIVGRSGEGRAYSLSGGRAAAEDPRPVLMR